MSTTSSSEGVTTPGSSSRVNNSRNDSEGEEWTGPEEGTAKMFESFSVSVVSGNSDGTGARARNRKMQQKRRAKRILQDGSEDVQLVQEPHEVETPTSPLPQNIYSIMYVADVWSQSFLFAIVVSCFQATMTCLAMADLIDSSNSYNPLAVPPDVTTPIRIAQGMSVILAVAMQEDVKGSILTLHAGYNSHALEKSPHATFKKWVVAYLLQLFVGLGFLVVIFILVVRSSGLIDILLNFAALAFITEIDDIAFNLAKQGYVNASLQDVCLHVDQHEIPDLRRSQPFHRILIVCLMLIMFVMWAYIAYLQWMGTYFCDSFFVQFGDSHQGMLPTYSGYYDLDSSSNNHLDGRKVFKLRGFDGEKAAYFRYCKADKFWAYQVMAATENKSVKDICGDYMLRSEETDSFDILSLKPSSWSIRGFDASNAGLSDEVFPFDYMYMQCATCDSTCKGTCEEDICVCPDDRFGDYCEFTDACPQISLDSNTQPFSSHSFQISTEFSLLNYIDNNQNSKPVRVHNRPVYYYRWDESTIDYMLFNGRRWLVFDYQEENGNTITPEDFARRFLAEQFHLLFSDFIGIPYFLSGPVDAGTPSNSVSPTGVDWYKRGPVQAQFFDVGPPVSSRFVCQVCNEYSNTCFNGGYCADGACECETSITQAVGALCEYELTCWDAGCLNGGECDTGTGDCSCPENFGGRLCQTYFCSSAQVCFNGATSCDEDGACICADGYVGDSCEAYDCSVGGCINGGVCMDDGQCDCALTDFTGNRCETE